MTTLDLSRQLSPHFQLWELIHSQHQTIDNTPSDEVLARLENLCVYLEKIRGAFGPMRVTSGYRCPALNVAIGGVVDSAHTFGCAADIFPLDPLVSVGRMVMWIAASSLDYDQVIDEGTNTGSWCHFGMLRPGFEPLPRREALVMRNGVYAPFIAKTTGAAK
jgi:zinc D-Ala-D-Ala carboxypeptidase